MVAVPLVAILHILWRSQHTAPQIAPSGPFLPGVPVPKWKTTHTKTKQAKPPVTHARRAPPHLS
jgi:hypothetical protein